MKVKIYVEKTEVELTTDQYKLVFKDKKEIEDCIDYLNRLILSYEVKDIWDEESDALNKVEPQEKRYFNRTDFDDSNEDNGIELSDEDLSPSVIIPLEDRTLIVSLDKNDFRYDLSYNEHTKHKHFILEQKIGEDTIGYINIDNSVINDLSYLFLKIDIDNKHNAEVRKKHYSSEDNVAFRKELENYLLSKGFETAVLYGYYFAKTYFGKDLLII